MSQDLVGGGKPGGGAVGWGRRVPEEGQKNVRLERFKEGARDEQNMRLGPQQERLWMETKERESLNTGPAVWLCLCRRELTSN